MFPTSIPLVIFNGAPQSGQPSPAFTREISKNFTSLTSFSVISEKLYPVICLWGSFAPITKLFIPRAVSSNKISTFLSAAPKKLKYPGSQPNASTTSSSTALRTSRAPTAFDNFVSSTSLSPRIITSTGLSGVSSSAKLAIYKTAFKMQFSLILKNFAKSSIVLTLGVSTVLSSLNPPSVSVSFNFDMAWLELAL